MRGWTKAAAAAALAMTAGAAHAQMFHNLVPSMITHQRLSTPAYRGRPAYGAAYGTPGRGYRGYGAYGGYGGPSARDGGRWGARSAWRGHTYGGGPR